MLSGRISFGSMGLKERRREHVFVYLVKDSFVKRLVDTNKGIVQFVQQEIHREQK